MWGCPPLIACAALFHDHGKEKRMKASQLTTIAALPMGGGCMSALPAEKNEAKKPEPAQTLMESDPIEWMMQQNAVNGVRAYYNNQANSNPLLSNARMLMRSSFFQEPVEPAPPPKQDEGPMVYVPSLGIFIPAVWPPLFKETEC
jgi:hypothetical protein